MKLNANNFLNCCAYYTLHHNDDSANIHHFMRSHFNVHNIQIGIMNQEYLRNLHGKGSVLQCLLLEKREKHLSSNIKSASKIDNT